MSQDKRYQANPAVSCGKEDDGAVLYNPDTDNSSIINLTALEIWEYLQEPRTAGEVVQHLLRQYRGASVEQADKDLHLFIETLSPDFLVENDDG